MTQRRWGLLKTLCGAGTISIRDGKQRGVCQAKSKAVTALLGAGLLNCTESGAIEFPYEVIKVEFLSQAVNRNVGAPGVTPTNLPRQIENNLWVAKEQWYLME